MAVADKPGLQEESKEVIEKVEVMASFKKTYLKFSLGLDRYLKKDTLHAPSSHHTHICIHVYMHVYIYIYIYMYIDIYICT
jgi:hypothetical protein